MFVSLSLSIFVSSRVIAAPGPGDVACDWVVVGSLAGDVGS